MTKIYDREEKSQVWDSLQKKIVSTGFCLPSTKCLLKKVPYGITSCLGKNRTGPTLVRIVVVVLKRNGLMEILWSSMSLSTGGIHRGGAANGVAGR